MKIICIGRNYHCHIKEMNSEIPAEPVFFFKPDTALLIRNRPFFIPDFSEEIHYEAELIIKICKSGKSIDKNYADNYFDQIGLGIDFTARDIQRDLQAKGLPWEKSKAFDYSAAISSFIDKKILHPENGIAFNLFINGSKVQESNSNNMIFNFNEIIAHISRFITLRVGDIIFTGTPAGVGKVSIGDKIEGFINNENILKFNIK